MPIISSQAECWLGLKPAHCYVWNQLSSRKMIQVNLGNKLQLEKVIKHVTVLVCNWRWRSCFQNRDWKGHTGTCAISEPLQSNSFLSVLARLETRWDAVAWPKEILLCALQKSPLQLVLPVTAALLLSTPINAPWDSSPGCGHHQQSHGSTRWATTPHSIAWAESSPALGWQHTSGQPPRGTGILKGSKKLAENIRNIEQSLDFVLKFPIKHPCQMTHLVSSVPIY